MTSTDTSTSSQLSAAAMEDHKRTVDEAFLNKLKGLVERLRLENANLKKSLDIERGEVRALKARHESTIRNLKTECKKKEDLLEKQLRSVIKPEKIEEPPSNYKMVELKKLTTEIQSLKAANKGLQEKLKVAQAAECARAAELRAQAAKHNALEHAARRDARAQCHKLLEEIKSKERVIIQLKREAARTASNEQAQRMECGATDFGRKRGDQVKEKSNREDLKTDIQHRKENFYREAPSDEDSAVSSAPASLSPQPLNEMWSCGQCRTAAERAASAARECTRLSDALRDARDQLELMEFRLLELEDATPDKGARDNLTDSDSGCVSPGSRIKDSASPEFKRMDSGYKSPHTPSSPCNPRRHISHEEFNDEFAKAQILSDNIDRNSEASDSLKSNPMKEHLEQMILNAASAEDRSCLEQVLMMLYNFQALSSSVSEDECYQAKPKRICDLRLKSDIDIPSHKTHKAIATVTPYQQKGYKSDSLESLCEERKPSNILQESGIFEGVETETKFTQTEEAFEFTSELNTEIQRLNSIREKLEKQGVRNRNLSDVDSLECKCVKLGKKHKQYYERRLKFLEGKISIYEAAQDVKESKLAQRLQKEFLLENRIQDLESELLELQDKYERLEEDCCELEEIENDTRLHWQQLEMDYELSSAQLRDMTEQRECSRAHAERVAAQLRARDAALRACENELLTRLQSLERAVPALIAWNVLRTVGASITCGTQKALINRISPLPPDTKTAITRIKEQDRSIVPWQDSYSPRITELQMQVNTLISERKEVDKQSSQVKKVLEDKVKTLEEELAIAKRQMFAAVSGAEIKKDKIEGKIEQLEDKIKIEKQNGQLPVDPLTKARIQALLSTEQELNTRIAELERREAAYLEMLTQADDMWAEMESGYKKKIDEAVQQETLLKGKVKKLETERDQWKNCFEPLKKKLREIEESESGMRIALEKAERDAKTLKIQNSNLNTMFGKADAEAKKAEAAVKALESRFKKEIDQLRKSNKQMDEDLKSQRDISKRTEIKFMGDLECIRKELSRACKNNQELEVTNSELKEEFNALIRQQYDFDPAIPDAIKNLKALQKVLCGASKVDNSSQYGTAKESDGKTCDGSKWQYVDDPSDIDKYIAKEKATPIIKRKNGENIRINDIPTIKVIAEKFEKYNKNNVELRKLKEKIVCLEYDVFGDNDVAPFQKLRAYFSLKPIDYSDTSPKTLPSKIRHNFNITDEDLKKINENEIEMIDSKITENKSYLDDLKQLLKRKQKFKTKKRQSTLDVRTLYEMAKNDTSIIDKMSTNLLTKDEIRNIKELIMRKSPTSVHGWSKRLVKQELNNDVSQSIIAQLLDE